MEYCLRTVTVILRYTERAKIDAWVDFGDSLPASVTFKIPIMALPDDVLRFIRPKRPEDEITPITCIGSTCLEADKARMYEGDAVEVLTRAIRDHVRRKNRALGHKLKGLIFTKAKIRK